VTPIAQTTTTVPPEIEVTEPSRPITDFLIDLFDLDPDGALARLVSSIVEPLVQIVVVLGVAWLILRLMRWAGRGFMSRAKGRLPLSTYGAAAEGVDRRNQRVDALGAVLNSALGLVIWTGALLIILGATFGINLTPFLAGAGVIGIAIGFGAQDLVKDFVSGIFMLIEDQFGVGDVIDVGDATGTVEKISLRTTRIRDVRGTVWHFPNGEIRRVGNLSQEWSRVLLDVTVGYGSDIDTAADVIRQTAEDMAGEDRYRGLFLAAPEVWGVESVTPDGVAIRLVIKTLPGEQAAISRELRRRIKKGLDGAGIEVPLAQRPVWLRPEGPTAGSE
jgi:small conductance mechanosensitive channel